MRRGRRVGSYSPSTRKEAYQAFLKTLVWTLLAARCKKHAGHRCGKCGSTWRLQAHHHTYPAEWLKTTLEHLICLCENCHRGEHGLPPLPPSVIRVRQRKKKNKAMTRARRERKRRKKAAVMRKRFA